MAIHAARRYPRDLRALAAAEPERYLGMVVAVVELVDCQPVRPESIPPEPERAFGD